MPNVTLKKVPAQLYTQLKKSALRHRRSINGEAIVCLEKGLFGEPVDPESFLREVRALRKRIKRVYATERELRAAKNQGRI